MCADDDALLPKSAFQFPAIIAPPTFIDFGHHDLEDDDFVPVGRLAYLLPQTLGGSPCERCQPAKGLGEVSPDTPEIFLRESDPVIVVEGKEELNEMHVRTGPIGKLVA